MWVLVNVLIAVAHCLRRNTVPQGKPDGRKVMWLATLCPQLGKEEQIGNAVGDFSYSLSLANLLKVLYHSKAVPPPRDQEFKPMSFQGTFDVHTPTMCITSYNSLPGSWKQGCVLYFPAFVLWGVKTALTLNCPILVWCWGWGLGVGIFSLQRERFSFESSVPYLIHLFLCPRVSCLKAVWESVF